VWTGREWHVGVDAELEMRLGACGRGGLGQVDVDADTDIISADSKDVMAMSDDILLDFKRVG
jgi:hypothetical protein